MFVSRFVSLFKPLGHRLGRLVVHSTDLVPSLSSRSVHARTSANSRLSIIDEDIMDKTEDKRIIQLSHYVMNNNLQSSLVVYSSLPLFLPRSDFRIVCSLMKQLGVSCGIPDLENIFTKIQKMRLTRRHALTMRCLIRLSCEIGSPKLIESFYKQVCQEEIYVNNAFINDIVMDCLFSLDAYESICSVIDSLHVCALSLHHP